MIRLGRAWRRALGSNRPIVVAPAGVPCDGCAGSGRTAADRACSRCGGSGRVARNKYNARTVTIDGLRFDSRKEGRRYRELVRAQWAGDVERLQVHPVFELIVAGQRIGKYTPDFFYVTAWGEVIVEDVKGVRTRDYVLRKKLFKALYAPLVVTEV